MNRRTFLSSAGAFPAFSTAQVRSSRDNDDRPNILILMADQHSPHVIGAHGDPVVRTPNLDALAARGVTFRNAYCQAPLCVPSRMSFLTSRQPSDIRVWGNDDTLPSNTPTFAHALGAAGYETILIGRMHFNGTDQWHGFQKREVGAILPIYSYLPMPMPEKFMVGARNSSRGSVQLAGPGHTAYQSYDDEVVQKTREFLLGKANGRQKPFCAVAGFVLPHSPYICTREQWDYYLPRVTVPKVPAGYYERLHPAILHWREVRGLGSVTGEEVRRARAGYYALVTEIDRRVGEILNTLREAGLERNTVVIYTSDHGEMAGELGMWWKSNFYEGAVTVPLLISCPARFRPARQLQEVVSLVDVGCTLTELASTDPMPLAAGRSLLPLLRDEKPAWQNEAFSEFPAAENQPAIRMIRRGRWKLVHYDGQRPQLFDLEADPQEFNDLGASEDHAQVRRSLEERALDGWSAAEIQKERARNAVAQRLIRKWEMAVKPRPEAQWTPPAGASRLE